ncbi:MAG: ABC transporter ATP-binding protein [Myxococcales bacterium]|nr:ABC transporter ATP-binding protein [Myxococcales bacterium]
MRRPPRAKDDSVRGLERARVLARVGVRTFRLVLRLHPRLVGALVALTLLAGALPAAIAWVGKRIVDDLVQAFVTHASVEPVLVWVGIELGLVVLLQAVERGQWLTQALLRPRLAQTVHEQLLDKSLGLELPDLERPEVADQLSRARQGASFYPLSFVMGAFAFARTALTLAGYGFILWQLTPWALLFVVAAAVPAFIVELRFSEDGFRAFRWRAEEARRQAYLESVMAREEHAKEVRLFHLGPWLMARYRALFEQHYEEDRQRTLRQAWLGFGVGLGSVLVFYGSYAWVAVQTARGELSFGDLTLYLMVFRRAQGALGELLSRIEGEVEGLRYVAELFAFLDLEPTRVVHGDAKEGPDPSDGLRFDDVVFTYPDAKEPTLRGVTLHLPPGHKLALVGENGAGKTTLIKLMAGLYRPDAGTISLDGLELSRWDPVALRRRIGVIFQDFVRYQLLVGENVGVGDVDAVEDEARWRAAATKGLADSMIESLPDTYQTQLGRWFEGGRELSGGQWQKIALARAFMREGADILVLDEPTAAMDALAEAKVFERFQVLAEARMVILISHRFSTVRMADTIAVLEGGRVVERGTHDELLAKGGRYAELFLLQARGYR